MASADVNAAAWAGRLEPLCVAAAGQRLGASSHAAPPPAPRGWRRQGSRLPLVFQRSIVLKRRAAGPAADTRALSALAAAAAQLELPASSAFNRQIQSLVKLFSGPQSVCSALARRLQGLGQACVRPAPPSPSPTSHRRAGQHRLAAIAHTSMAESGGGSGGGASLPALLRPWLPGLPLQRLSPDKAKPTSDQQPEIAVDPAAAAEAGLAGPTAAAAAQAAVSVDTPRPAARPAAAPRGEDSPAGSARRGGEPPAAGAAPWVGAAPAAWPAPPSAYAGESVGGPAWPAELVVLWHSLWRWRCCTVR